MQISDMACFFTSLLVSMMKLKVGGPLSLAIINGNIER